MTYLADLGKTLQKREDNYNAQLGGKKVVITPPMLKYTLSDPDMYKIDPRFFLKIASNSFIVYLEDGVVYYEQNEDWEVYEYHKVYHPMWLRQKERYINYKGCLFGDACIIFSDVNDEALEYYRAPSMQTITDAYILVPKGTCNIKVSRYKHANVKVNFEMIFQEFEEMNVTEYVSNETDLEVSLLRDGTSGVYVESSMPVYLTLMAKEFIDGAFLQSGLKTKIAFNVYLRDDVDINKYELTKSATLNFSSYKSSRDIVELNLVDSSLNELINSRGKSKYDVKVSEITENKKWNYERMTMLNRGNYEMPVNQKPYSAFGFKEEYMQPFVYMGSSEMTPGSEEHDIKKQSSREYFDTNNYFFKVANMLDSESFIGTLKMGLSLQCLENLSPLNTSFAGRIDIYVLKNNDVNDPVFAKSLNAISESGSTKTYELKIEENIPLDLLPNDALSLVLFRDGGIGNYAAINCIEFNAFSITYNSKGININGVDIIKPEEYCQKLLDLVSEQPYRFDCSFDWGNLDYKPMICAAESIRALDNANIKGSLVDFLDWMYVMGYEYACNEYTLIFKPRDAFYNRDITTLTLKQKENADLVLESSDELACASIEIGFEQQDYESVNGRFEVNGSFEYSTGYISPVKSNSLKLISPYRADPIGIELLFWERKSNSKDTKSDNDIFVIAMTEEDTHYKVYSDIVAIPNEAPLLKMFNAVFNPFFLVNRNESLIGVNTDKLTFIGTSSNRECKIEPEGDIYRDRNITKQLFKPYVYNFVTGNHIPIPKYEFRDGLVKFLNDGKWRQGFIKRIYKNYSKESESTWILHSVD